MLQENLLSSIPSPSANTNTNSNSITLINEMNNSVHSESKDNFYTKEDPQLPANERNESAPKSESRAGSLISNKSSLSLSKSDTDSMNDSLEANNSMFPPPSLLHSSSSSSSVSIPTRKLIRSGSGSSETLKAKRSNFQWTYDSDNYLLSLITNNQAEIFTRGNTCKTWEVILREFNEEYKSNILQTRTINNRFKSLMKDFKNRMQNETFVSNEDFSLVLNENEKLLHRLHTFIEWKKMKDGMKRRKIKPLDTSNDVETNDLSLITELNDHNFNENSTTSEANEDQFNNNSANSSRDLNETQVQYNTQSESNTNFQNSQISSELSLPTEDQNSFHFTQQPNFNENILTNQEKFPMSQFMPTNNYQSTSPGSSRTSSRLDQSMVSPHAQSTTSSFNSQQYAVQVKSDIPERTQSLGGQPTFNYNSSAINQLILLQNRQSELLNKLRHDFEVFKKEQNSRFDKIVKKIESGENDVNLKLSSLLELFLNKEEFESNLMKCQKALSGLNSQEQTFDTTQKDADASNSI